MRKFSIFWNEKGREVKSATRRMVLGTGSGVGKSLVVAGICRAAARMGLRVMPFKSQNMSNNSAVLPGGGEIARAQALQARAALVVPEAGMNPVLLKPMDKGRSQVIFLGRSLGIFSISEYRELKKELFPKVCEIFENLAARCDLVVLEGAGSPAEINHLDEDIANIRMARAVDAQAMLLGDIERGGVFAQLFGTLELLPPEDRSIIRWFAINKFRGERALLDSGMEAITNRTGVPFLGVMDHMGPLALPDEDSFRTREAGGDTELSCPGIHIVVIEWPHLSNRSDIDPFLNDKDVRVSFLSLSAAPPEHAHAIVLPGTRQTMEDLRAFYDSPLYPWFCEQHKKGTLLFGICGGYQMLGHEIRDPEGVESSRSWMPGLALLPFSVRFHEKKIARPVQARIFRPPFSGPDSLVGMTVSGYEIRQGRQTMHEGALPCFELYDNEGVSLGGEGLVNASGTVFGSPVHGLFDSTPFRQAFYTRVTGKRHPDSSMDNAEERIDRELDRLADAVMEAFPMGEFLGHDRTPFSLPKEGARSDVF